MNNKVINNSLPLIHCQDLCQYFDDADERVTIFESLNLSLEQGESIAITGASGSGKSTLLYLLGGLEQPKTGTLHVDGVDLSKLSANKLAKFRNHTLGFVYQFHHLLPEFSALENVAMPLMIRGENISDITERAKDLLVQVGLEHRIHHLPSMMSGGERQRTAIARALINEPKCILADEPTGNLDNKTARQVYELLLSLNEEYKTSLVVVTHDQDLAAQMQRKVVLHDGALINAVNSR
ncbi:MAG: lipoprotein-releasing ABC transporter ATP-binding protein LolD [Gammaproteobacteria bacterium]|nr:lipoprotein-releasing ABC transporter ATP-binding protein LolD [Gammaproteobacteria bacterium]